MRLFSPKKSTQRKSDPPVQTPALPEKTKTKTHVKGDKRPNSPRSSKSFTRGRAKKAEDAEHPLNHYRPERFSSAAMTTSDGGVNLGSDPMQTTPAPETPGAFPMNGVNGDHFDEEQEESGPVPPPHQIQSSPLPQPEKLAVDAEACKAAGNKFYKAKQYQMAIDEYSKGP